MNRHIAASLLACIAMVLLAGCSGPGSNPQEVTTPGGIPIPSPADNQTCTRAADCVPAQCCHPTRCENQVHVCNLLCTASCEGPLDCGAGTCGCQNGRCAVIPTSLDLMVKPARYSPVMSSTVGIGMEVNTSRFGPRGVLVTWNASWGYFLSWGTDNWTVQHLGETVTNHGERVYWSFMDRPAPAADPVFITVTARDPDTGRVIGRSVIPLSWDGDVAVAVQGPYAATEPPW